MTTRVRGHQRRKNNRPPDIKAPDGYVLGGTRRVNKDGTIRLCGTFYQCPPEWAGKWLSCHTNDDGMAYGTLDVCMDEGVHIFVARMEHRDRVYRADPAEGKKDPVNRTLANIRKKQGRSYDD